MKGHLFVQLNTHSSDTFLLLCKAQAALSITPRRYLAERAMIIMSIGLPLNGDDRQ